MRKRLNIIYISLFLIMMIIPLVLTNTEEGYVSNIDNRQLMDAPEFGTEDYSSNLELYIQDRIGLRNQMIRLYDLINDVVGGELTHPLYSYGKNGYIFFNQHDNIVFDDYHKTFAEMVLKMQKYCEDRGTYFYFVFNPEKTSVLREETTKGENYDDSWADELLSYMDELGVNYVDNKELLTQVHLEEAVFNKKYDAGHWNDLGCFYGTNNLLARIHEDIPEVTELQAEEFDITTRVEKYLPNSEFIVNEEVPVFTLKSPYDDYTEKYYSEVDRNENYQYLHYYRNKGKDADKLPRTLVFQGSYYNSRPQFLVSRTSEDIGIHNYQNVMELDYYYNLFQPDVVVFEVAEYTISQGYFDNNKMDKIDWNPAIMDSHGMDDYENTLNTILSSAVNISTEAEVKVIEGNAIDTVFLDRKIKKAKYAYLITDKAIYDMNNNSGKLSASVLHAEIGPGQDVYLYYADKTGNKYYCSIPVKEAQQLNSSNIKTSENTIYDANTDAYILTTDVNNNSFNAVALQQIGAAGEFIKDIKSSDSIVTKKGMFTNSESSRKYRLRLKANSYIKDEWVEYETQLSKNQVCYYTFSINTLNSKEVSFSKFKIFK